MVGQTVSHYKILEKLGEGGMGVVYKARDTHLDRFVAIKVLPPEKTANPERKRRFVQEAKSASALNHPNIVTVYDIDQQDGVDFIAMEFVAGKTLDAMIPRKGMRLGDVLKYSVQIADALAAAHGAGVIHRDLKPGNIMVGDDGRVRVLDFGLAKLTEPLGTGSEGETQTIKADSAPRTEEGTILGTVAYMSPEHAEGRKVDARSDIFSFGSVLYEMVSGQPPFQGDSKISTLGAIIHKEPAPLPGGIPHDLVKLITRCLRKDSTRRFQHMDDLKVALEELKKESDSGWAPAPMRGEVPSIAVLPFANLSADPENEYFSDGLAEEIINAVTKVPGLRVTARTSSFAFRGRDLDVRRVGAELNVGHILEGSVRKAGDRLRVTAQLINVADGYHLWSERYDRRMADIFDIQDEISQAIVDKLRVELAGETPRVKRYTENVEAYNLYLKGNYYKDRFTGPDLARSKELFKQAIAIDPNYPLAHYGMGYFYWLSAWMGCLAPREAVPESKSLLQKAVELDDSLGEAHALLGVVLGHYDYAWGDAEREFQWALKLDPGSPLIRDRYAFGFLRPMARLEEAIAELQRTVEQDPLSPLFNLHLGWFLWMNRQDDLAIRQMRDVVELDPSYFPGPMFLGVIWGHVGDLDRAVSALERARELSGGYPHTLGYLGWIHGKAGRTQEAHALLTELREAARTTYVPASAPAFIYLGLGETDGVFECLTKAYDDREPYLPSVRTDPLWGPIRADPRYHALLRKMHLAPEEN